MRLARGDTKVRVPQLSALVLEIMSAMCLFSDYSRRQVLDAFTFLYRVCLLFPRASQVHPIHLSVVENLQYGWHTASSLLSYRNNTRLYLQATDMNGSLAPPLCDGVESRGANPLRVRDGDDEGERHQGAG